jgi:hypothetical protein
MWLLIVVPSISDGPHCGWEVTNLSSQKNKTSCLPTVTAFTWISGERHQRQAPFTGSSSWCYVTGCGDEYVSARFDCGVSVGWGRVR